MLTASNYMILPIKCNLYNARDNDCVCVCEQLNMYGVRVLMKLAYVYFYRHFVKSV